jgi:hypothetical protein
MCDDNAVFCTNCGFNFQAAYQYQNQNQNPNIQYGQRQYPQQQYQQQYIPPQYVQQPQEPIDENKKDSPLSIIACLFSALGVIVSSFFAIIGILLGIIDLAINNKRERHLGSIFAVIVGVIALLYIVLTMQKIFNM